MKGAWKLAAAVSGLLRAASVTVPLCIGPAVLALGAAGAVLKADIPAGPLGQALSTLAEQTGLQFVYLAAVVRDQRSQAVAAGAPVDAALARMLQGTTLKFEHLTANSIRILNPVRAVSAVAEGPIEDLVVTANRRDESLQNVPITIEVLTGGRLASVNATTFDDLVAYLPAVTSHGVGPAQNSVYVRGLATAEYANQAIGSNGVFPNVAIYLDEQSAQLPGRNLDIYAADIDRIEVLEGPQGTLFGAGAQAGVLRYITNRPKLNVLEGSVTASGADTAHGAPSGAVSAVLNLPLIADRLALRGVIYDERRGGYLDNTPATFARAASDRSIHYANYPAGCGAPGAPACQVPPDSVALNNFSQLGGDINTVTYTGTRVQALLKVSDDWDVLLAQSYQTMKADGVFGEEQTNSLGVPQAPLTVQLFSPSYDKDRFENTALTVTGKLGPLKLLYAGSYLVRNIDQVQDYVNYARGGEYVDYYQCVNPGGTSATAKCFTPAESWHDRERNTHLSQELRLSTPDDWRVRGVGGLFYEDYRIQDQGDWFYETALPYFNPVGPPTGYYAPDGTFINYPAESNNPNVRPPGDAFFNDITRGYTQKAAFASLDYDLVPDVLILTAGTRYFYTRDSEVGSSAGATLCRTYDNPLPPVPDPCIDHHNFRNLSAEGLDQNYAGFRSRANVSFRVSKSALLYYTWSQGFRAGGFNRFSGISGSSPLSAGPADYQALASAHQGFTLPGSFGPDELVNNELGWKTRWLDHRLQWNGALYQEDWQHAQVTVLDSVLLNNATFNGGNYRVRGLETSLIFQVLGGLSLEAGAVLNHSQLVKQASFYWNDGTLIDFGALTTANGERLSNPAGLLGSPLAGAPALRGNVRARYEINLGNMPAFAQLGAVHQSSTLASTDRARLDLQASQFDNNLPGFTVWDGAIGVTRGDWAAQLNGENLLDKRAALYSTYAPYYQAVTVNRPRTVSLRLSYRFGD